jgi:YYY domain-containing protein
MELVPLLRWTLLLAGTWAVGLPSAYRLFERFPYRGATMALPVVLTVVSLVAYWVGRVDVTLGFVAGVLLVVGLAVVGYRRAERPAFRHVVAPVAVFGVAFAAMLFVRLGSPAIVPAGGEKFLDFSLLNAVLRTDTLPPEDPWFAGRTVRYYYGGYVTAGLLTKASGVEPRYAYNLLVPTVYAMLATAAFGLAAAIADRRGVSPSGAGVAAAFFAAASGTLATPARFVLGLVPRQVPESVARVVVGGIRAPLEDALAAATDPASWSPWLGRYVIEDTPDVFPAWTFVNGDLRPHMMSAPLLLFAAAVVYAYYLTPDDERWRRRGLLFGVVPAVGGWLAVTNTWSFPVVLGLVALAVTFAAAPARTLFGIDDRRFGDQWADGPGSAVVREVTSVTGAAVTAAVVAGLGVAWVAPYVVFHTATGDGIGLLPPNSPVGQFLLVHGGFLALFVAFLGPPVRELLGDRSTAVAGGAILGTLVSVLALSSVGYTSLAVLVLVGIAAWAVARRRTTGFATVLILAGVGLVGFAELAYLKVWPHDPNALRWNTIYKIYHAVWLLWGTAAGVALATLSSWVVRSGQPATASETVRHLGRRYGTALLVVVVVTGMAVFPAAAGATHVDDVRDGATTLDGLEYVSVYHPDEAAAIAWLDERPGTPTIVSAPGLSPYTWANAPSSLTGVPTVLGWVHEKGYRGSAAYEDRRFDVRVLYEGDPRSTTITAERYDVAYVYVGPRERERYDLAGIEGNPQLTVAFEEGAVTIYRVETVTRRQ